MAGEDCSQPPEGVALMRLPHRSTTSRWQVSPRASPVARTVGSPEPPWSMGPPLSRACSSSVSSGGRAEGSPVSGLGRNRWEASSVSRARRAARCSGDSSCSRSTSASPKWTSRSASASLRVSRMVWAPCSVEGSSCWSGRPSRMPRASSRAGPCPQAAVLATVQPRKARVAAGSKRATAPARSSPVSTPAWSAPSEWRCGVRTNSAMARATGPVRQRSRAAAIRAARPSRAVGPSAMSSAAASRTPSPAVTRSRSTAAYSGLRSSSPGRGGAPSGIHSAAELGQCSVKVRATVSIWALTRASTGCPFSAQSIA